MERWRVGREWARPLSSGLGQERIGREREPKVEGRRLMALLVWEEQGVGAELTQGQPQVSVWEEQAADAKRKQPRVSSWEEQPAGAEPEQAWVAVGEL